MTLKIIIGLGLLVFLYLYFRDTNTEPLKNKQQSLFIPSEFFFKLIMMLFILISTINNIK